MTPKTYAEECLHRIEWRCPTVPSPNTLADTLGIVVTGSPRDTRPDAWDGLSIVTGDGWIILVNRSQAWVRRQWTLTHEMGHILQHGVEQRGLWHQDPTERNESMEREADSFAREFLMPAELMWSLYSQLGTDTAALARHLRLSRPAVAWRMQELGIGHRQNAVYCRERRSHDGTVVDPRQN
ncbi:MAG: ImmA/IrrE family metallo-endopeptidase [Firmicutes bacterium]|nr:ImmA/IrrE family metallo-endopeptidase [Bacillota bacterium]